MGDDKPPEGRMITWMTDTKILCLRVNQGKLIFVEGY